MQRGRVGQMKQCSLLIGQRTAADDEPTRLSDCRWRCRSTIVTVLVSQAHRPHKSARRKVYPTSYFSA